MTVPSIPSTSSSAPAGGLDATASEQSAEHAASGFGLLLAGAQADKDPTAAGPALDVNEPGVQAAKSGAEQPDAGNRAADGGNTTDANPPANANDTTSTGATTGGSPPPPAPKPASATDTTGAAGALGLTPATTSTDTPTADVTDSTPVSDLADAPTVASMLDLAIAALSASGPADSAAPDSAADATAPSTTPAIEDALAALSEPATGGGNSATSRTDHAPAELIPSARTLTDSSPSVTNGGTAHPVVDTAGPSASERPRPQPASSGTPNGAATFAASAPAPTNAAQNIDDGTAATATIAPPPPAEQLVSVLNPLRATPNGSYTLHLELKPPELGRVELRVEMRDGVLHASIHAEHEGAGQTVRDALGELRDRLNAQGVRTGDLTVSDGGVGPGSRDGDDGRASSPASSQPAMTSPDESALADAIATLPDPNSTSLLDVRV